MKKICVVREGRAVQSWLGAEEMPPCAREMGLCAASSGALPPVPGS